MLGTGPLHTLSHLIPATTLGEDISILASQRRIFAQIIYGMAIL